MKNYSKVCCESANNPKWDNGHLYLFKKYLVKVTLSNFNVIIFDFANLHFICYTIFLKNELVIEYQSLSLNFSS